MKKEMSPRTHNTSLSFALVVVKPVDNFVVEAMAVSDASFTSIDSLMTLEGEAASPDGGGLLNSLLSHAMTSPSGAGESPNTPSKNAPSCSVHSRAMGDEFGIGKAILVIEVEARLLSAQCSPLTRNELKVCGELSCLARVR